jgi:hypothetical protein
MKLLYYSALILLTGAVICSEENGAEKAVSSERIYGVTISSVKDLKDITESLSKLSKKPTARIVFDEWVPATQYSQAVKEIHKVSYTMGEILDSYYMKEYNLKTYKDRVKEYTDALGDEIDIWEIGNEVNGEWTGSRIKVAAKIEAAYNYVKSSNRKTAVTLFYNANCYSNEKNKMFEWAQSYIPDYMKQGLDYVFVSFYNDDCPQQPPDWENIFDSLHVMFPNSKLGIGECGTKNKSEKELMIKKFYRMEVEHPNFVGGYFWWYYKKDCVPYTKELWSVLNEAIK